MKKKKNEYSGCCCQLLWIQRTFLIDYSKVGSAHFMPYSPISCQGPFRTRPILYQNFCLVAHHTIRKVKFLSKDSILTKPQHFHEFFTQSCQQLKSAKSQQFHEFFTPKNRQFFREIKVEFLDKKWRFRTVWFCDFASEAIFAKMSHFSVSTCS